MHVFILETMGYKLGEYQCQTLHASNIAVIKDLKEMMEKTAWMELTVAMGKTARLVDKLCVS